MEHDIKRYRVNRAAICSSVNYESSRKIHIEMLRENHEVHIDILQTINISIKRPYIKVWGELIEITVEEANNLSIEVIWK